MTKVSRNDIYVRDERCVEWFNDFLLSLADTEPSSVQEILSAINHKRTETAESVVQDYRHQVGLDSLISQEDNDDCAVKQASANFRPLSVRHASKDKSIVQIIKDDDDLKAKIDSHCEHTGGTKNIEALIGFLREMLGDQVSFSDDGLREYLNERKDYFRDGTSERGPENVGRVGIDANEEYEDKQADYIKNDGKI